MINIKTIFQSLSRLPEFVASAALFILMLMTFSDVLMRSILNAPIEAATELTRLLMAIMVFSVLPVISAKDTHIVVDLLDSMFRNPIIIRMKAVMISMSCGLMLLWPASRVIVLAERARSYGDVTEYLHIPQFYIAWFIAIMTIITAGVLIVRALILLFAPKFLEY